MAKIPGLFSMGYIDGEAEPMWARLSGSEQNDFRIADRIINELWMIVGTPTAREPPKKPKSDTDQVVAAAAEYGVMTALAAGRAPSKWCAETYAKCMKAASAASAKGE